MAYETFGPEGMEGGEVRGRGQDHHPAAGGGGVLPRPEELGCHAKSCGDLRFHALLKEIGALHDRKQQDYGSNSDPFANVRASQEWGVAPWIGALVRLNDKVHRLKRFAAKGSLANESAEDSMLDVAVYSLIALLLYREQGGPQLVD